MKDESSPCEERDLRRSDQDQSELPFPTHHTPSLPVVFWTKAQVDLDVPQAAQVRAVEQMDRGVVDPDDVLFEQGPEEPRANVVDGHPSAELVEGRHDDRLLRYPKLPKEAIVVPAFNELCGGMPVNDIRARFLGPLFDEDIVRVDDAAIHLLDGTNLGRLRDIQVDLGFRPEDYRQ